MNDIKIVNFNRVLTVDPGYDTGTAFWKGTLNPETNLISTPRTGKPLDRIRNLSYSFNRLLVELNPIACIIEGVNLWGGSAVSQAGASQGYTFELSYLIGSYITRCQDLLITVKLVSVNEWKGQLPNSAVAERIARINGLSYPEHIQESVGIGFSELGLL